MNRNFFRIVAAAAMAMMLSSQAARAQDWTSWNWLFGNQDPRLTATGIVLGGGASAGYYALRHQHGPTAQNPVPTRIATPLGAYALTSIGCAAAFPIVGTLWLNRPLTTREVYTGMANCVVPWVGGWMMDYAFHGQAWYEGAPVRRHH